MPFLIMEGDESLDALGNQYADLGKYAAEKMHIILAMNTNVALKST